MAKVGLLLLSLWCSSHMAGAIQTKTGTIDAPVTMAARVTPTNQETLDEITTKLRDAELELLTEHGKTVRAAQIMDFEMVALAAQYLATGSLMKPFQQMFQKYQASLADQTKSNDVTAHNYQLAQDKANELKELADFMDTQYKITLFNLISSGDLGLLLPLLVQCKKKKTIQYNMDETQALLDKLSYDWEQTEHHVDAMRSALPLAHLVSWSPAIFHGFSAVAWKLTKKVDKAVHKLVDVELDDIKEFLANIAHLKEDAVKTYERVEREAATTTLSDSVDATSTTTPTTTPTPTPTTTKPLWEKTLWGLINELAPVPTSKPRANMEETTASRTTAAK